MIANKAKFLASNKQIEEFELIDKQRMKARERSPRKCNKVYAGGGELITKGEDCKTTTKATRAPNKTHHKVNKIKWKTFAKLARIT
eukprot:14706533-Ditylum_brightwellii.AAC.1